MKKLVISTTILLFILTGNSSAQLIRSYGVKVAFTSFSQAVVYGADKSGWWTGSKISSESGFDVAAYAEWLNFPFVSFLTQIEYDQRGARLDYITPQVGAYSSTEGHLSYLSVPVMAKFTLPVGTLSPYIMAGPRMDFLLSYRDFQIEPGPTPIYSNFKKTILGWSMGIGLDSGPLLPIKLLAEVRYDVDFITSYNDGNVYFHNNAVDVWLGVAL
jgi:hypothetical protein